MYSVVLMMAMTSSADVPVDCWQHSCNGGSCSGLFAGHSSCHGGGLFGGHESCHGGGLFGGHESCHGGGLFGGHESCHGGGLFGGHESCHGGGLFGGHSCHGGLFGGHKCHGGEACCGGMVMPAPVGACCGGAMMVSPPPPVAPPMPPVKPEPIKKPTEVKPVGAVSAPATIVVTLPADAKLTVDGNATTLTSAERLFLSPTLNPGVVYVYTLKAEFQKDGQPMTVTKTIEVRAGAETRVSMATADAVASR